MGSGYAPSCLSPLSSRGTGQLLLQRFILGSEGFFEDTAENQGAVGRHLEQMAGETVALAFTAYITLSFWVNNFLDFSLQGNVRFHTGGSRAGMPVSPFAFWMVVVFEFGREKLLQ